MRTLAMSQVAQCRSVDNEIEDPSGMAEDTSQWKIFVNGVYESGVYVGVQSEADIDKALPMIRLA